jgi:hypothetical protein
LNVAGKSDEKYLKLIDKALSVCLDYRPKFGKAGKKGLALAEFQKVYRADPFYAWFGLDSPLIYAAHKTAGGMTSLYRQLGIGCEKVFRQVLQDTLGLDQEEATWSYDVPKAGGNGTRKLKLDGRIPIGAVQDKEARKRIKAWMKKAAGQLKVDPGLVKQLRGPVFEVRQGYKSADSKRQNADIGNAANAYANRYLPVNMILSTQVSEAVAARYVRAQWLLLRGSTTGSSLDSTYVFCSEVLGYDLAGFFKRNKKQLKKRIGGIIKGLLKGN